MVILHIVIVFFLKTLFGDRVFRVEKWGCYGTVLFFLVKKWVFSTGRWIFCR